MVGGSEKTVLSSLIRIIVVDSFLSFSVSLTQGSGSWITEIVLEMLRFDNSKSSIFFVADFQEPVSRSLNIVIGDPRIYRKIKIVFAIYII